MPSRPPIARALAIALGAATLLPAVRGAWAGAYALHLLAAIAAAVAVRAAYAEPWPRRLGLTLALAFPAAGPIASAWLLGVARSATGAGVPAGALAIGAPGGTFGEPRPLRDAEEALRRELSVRPLADQLRRGNLAAKQEAALKLAATAEPTSVRILQSALSDPDSDTRLFASLAILKLEERFAAQLAQARQAAASGDAEACLALASCAWRYLETGLPMGKTALNLWHELAAAARRALGAGEGDMALGCVLLARAGLATGEPAAALDATEAALSFDPERLDAAILRCEALYALGELDQLPAAAAALIALAPDGSEAAKAARYWEVARV